MAVNNRVIQNKRTPGSSFKSVVQQRFEMSQVNARKSRSDAKIKPNDLAKDCYNCENTNSYNLIVNSRKIS